MGIEMNNLPELGASHLLTDWAMGEHIDEFDPARAYTVEQGIIDKVSMEAQCPPLEATALAAQSLCWVGDWLRMAVLRRKTNQYALKGIEELERHVG